jgi:hypothetical protein
VPGFALGRAVVVPHFVDEVAIVRGMPGQQRDPRFLEEMVGAFVDAPSDEAEQVMFKLAEEDPRLYANHRWREAVLQRGTPSSARRFIDLAAQGLFDGKSTDLWHLERQIGGLIREHAELRAHVYDLLTEGVESHGLALLARAVAERPDADGLLLLLKLQAEQKRSFMDWHTIQRVVTEEVPVADWKGAYNIMPVPAVALRRKLLAMTTSGGANDHAARCLRYAIAPSFWPPSLSRRWISRQTLPRPAKNVCMMPPKLRLFFLGFLDDLGNGCCRRLGRDFIGVLGLILCLAISGQAKDQIVSQRLIKEGTHLLNAELIVEHDRARHSNHGDDALG